jgi:hypothetical protein
MPAGIPGNHLFDPLETAFQGQILLGIFVVIILVYILVGYAMYLDGTPNCSFWSNQQYRINIAMPNFSNW